MSPFIIDLNNTLADALFSKNIAQYTELRFTLTLHVVSIYLQMLRT